MYPIHLPIYPSTHQPIYPSTHLSINPPPSNHQPKKKKATYPTTYPTPTYLTYLTYLNTLKKKKKKRTCIVHLPTPLYSSNRVLRMCVYICVCVCVCTYSMPLYSEGDGRERIFGEGRERIFIQKKEKKEKNRVS